MLETTESDGSVIFRVRVVPRASRTQLAGLHDGALRVRVAAPPVDGSANKELARFLSKALSVPSRNVEIVSGHSSTSKRVRILGISVGDLEALLRAVDA